MNDIYIDSKKNTPPGNNIDNRDIPVSKKRNERYSYADDAPQVQRKPVNSSSGNNNRYTPPPTKKKKKQKRVFSKIIIAIILILAISSASLFVLFSSSNYRRTALNQNVFVDTSKLTQRAGITNILLIGVDRRNADESSRSDAMLLVSIDTIHRRIKLTSFMRDSYVYIPELKYNTKLNAACNYGGAQMVSDTIEYNFNIKIDHYVLVDFNMFEEIIDAFGGVNVDITEAEARYFRDKVHLKDIYAGENVHLDGNEALWYCRIRKLDSDFMRTQRQRKVMSAIIKRAGRTLPFKLYRIAKEVIVNIETDMSPGKLTSLSMAGILIYSHFKTEQGSVPKDGTWSDKTINSQAVLSLDFEANREYLEEFIYGR